MTRIIRNPIFRFVVRWFLGLVFIVAGIEKIARPDLFAIAVDAYKLLPPVTLNLFAIIVPWVELLCGIFLVAGVYLRGGSVILMSLLGAFIVAIGSALLRGLTIDCGCFGEHYSSPVGLPKILEDTGMLVLALLVFLTRNGDAESAEGGSSGGSLHSA